MAQENFTAARGQSDNHPLFKGFPTESHSNWQWHELMQRSRLYHP